MMLGLLLTWFSAEVARDGAGFPPIAAVWFLAVPLLDMAVVIARRIGRGQSPFKAGRDHLHHVLIAAGLPPAIAVLAILALTLGMGAAGFLAWRAGIADYWMFYVFVLILGVSLQLSWQWRRILRGWKRRERRRRFQPQAAPR